MPSSAMGAKVPKVLLEVASSLEAIMVVRPLEVPLAEASQEEASQEEASQEEASQEEASQEEASLEAEGFPEEASLALMMNDNEPMI